MNMSLLKGRSRVCKNKNIEKKCLYISDERRKNSDISRFLTL